MGNLRLRFSVYLVDGFSIKKLNICQNFLSSSIGLAVSGLRSDIIHLFDDSSARIPPLMRKLRLFVCGGFVLPLKSATRKREIQPMEEIFSLLQLKWVEVLLSALKDSN